MAGPQNWPESSPAQVRPDQLAQRAVELVALEAVQDLLEEAEDQELVRRLRGDAAGLEVELLLGVYPGARGAVGAADVVRLDLEAGEGVGLRLVAQHKVAVALVGVRLLGVGIDYDQAGEDRARLVQEGVLVEEVRLRARRLVDLERPLVALPGARRDRYREHLREAAGRLELAERLMARLLPAEVEVERLDPRVPADDRRVELERERLLGPALGRRVGDPRPVAGVEVVRAARELPGGVARREIVDDGHARIVLRDDERVREDGRAGPRDGVDDDDRLVDLDPARDEDERPIVDEG